MKKFSAMILALVLVLTAMLPSFAFAENVGADTSKQGVIYVTGATHDQTYTVYKIFDATYNEATHSTAYTIASDSPWRAFFSESGDGYQYILIDGVNVTPKAALNDSTVADLAAKLIAYAKANNVKYHKQIVADKSTFVTAPGGSPNSLKIEVGDLGYYLVDSTVGALCALNTTNYFATITAKNGLPDSDKEVQEDSTGAWGDNNDASIGQIVNFRSVTELKAGAAGQRYVLHDVMSSGLTFNADSVEVTLTRGENTNTLTKGTDYTVNTSASDGCTFEIEFSPAFCDAAQNGYVITATYSAVLNENAVVGNEGNPNKITLAYGENSDMLTTPDTTVTNSWFMGLVKYYVDGNASHRLAGATFELHEGDMLADNTTDLNAHKNPMRLIRLTDEDRNKAMEQAGVPADKYAGVAYRLAKDGETTNVVTSVTTDESGLIFFVGVDSGKYHLVETAAPNGFNALSAPVAIEVRKDGSVTTNGSTPVSLFAVGIENRKGQMLPSTGGIGTTIFYVGGGILMVAAIVLLVTKKKMSAEEK